MRYAHLASRVFGVPLLIERGKLEVILSVLGPRLGLSSEDPQLSLEMYGPGDTGKSRKSYYVSEDKIGVISIIGPLVKRDSGEFLSGGPTTYGEVEQEFMDAATDPEIKGILLNVDSPGGESVGALELSDMIHSQRSSKPIYAAADGDAFSAAYALASAADQLYVTKSGGVGSVGVWMMHVDQSGFNKQKGLQPTFLFAGARKLDGNPHEPLTDEAREAFQAEVDRIYSMFVDTVARNRGISKKAVKQTEAGLYFGQDGVDIGFADQVGTFNDALAGLRAAITRRSKSRAAVSAAQIPTKEVGNMPPNEEVKADAGQTPIAEAVAVEQAPKQEPDKQPDPRGEALAYAVEVIELCGIAGLPAMAAGFIKAGKQIEDVRKDLQAARAKIDSETEIHSQVPLSSISDTGRGASTVNVADSPIVQAANRESERHAKARKE